MAVIFMRMNVVVLERFVRWMGENWNSHSAAKMHVSDDSGLSGAMSMRTIATQRRGIERPNNANNEIIIRIIIEWNDNCFMIGIKALDIAQEQK